MKYFLKFFKLRNLYIYLLILALFNIFFSTAKANNKIFFIDEIEISTPFEINFNKNQIIEEGFVQAFNQLILSIIQSKDQKKLEKISLREIKGTIETFSIKEEKFINEIYYVKINVSFNKKSIFEILEKQNIFPSLPIKKNLVFIPIIIDDDEREIKIFTDNVLYNYWNDDVKNFHLINYILPTADMEDYNFLKKNISNIENIDFSKLVNKYNLKDYIVSIIFKNNENIKLLNKTNINNKKDLKKIEIKNIDFEKKVQINKLIENLKTNFEDQWKQENQINRSIKLLLTVSIENKNNFKIKEFEKQLSNLDLINDFYVYKFNNRNNFYKIIFNGSRNKFLQTMKNLNYELKTNKKIWIVK